MNTTMGFCAVSSNGKSFVDTATGEKFVPFGLNYYDPHTGWAPQVWKEFHAERIRSHFALMKQYGVNIARVFTASTAFVPEPDRIDPVAFDKLDQLIEIARESGIRLLLTGPDAWEGVPDYWGDDPFAEPANLQALTTFWKTAAVRYCNEPVIFAWDLLNEPTVRWDTKAMQTRWQEWLKRKYEDDLGIARAWGLLPENESLAAGTVSIPPDKNAPGDAKLWDFQLFRETVARSWAEIQVKTIRDSGDRHLVTIGYIQWSYPGVRGWEPSGPSVYAAFRPQVLDDLLDFHSIHFYPTLGDPKDPVLKERNLRYLKDCLNFCCTGKPVVLEEFGWYGGGAVGDLPERTEADQKEWNERVVAAAAPHVSGWLAWPFADTPSSTDCSKFGGIVTDEGKEKQWGTSFRRLAACYEAHEPDGTSGSYLSIEGLRQLVTGPDQRSRI